MINNLKDKKGETLVETIVSFVLFLILLGTVIYMVQLSLKIIGQSSKRLDSLNTFVSDIESNANLISEGDYTFNFNIYQVSYDNTLSDINVNVSMDVEMKSSGGLKIYALK